ncbi:MAG: hypothetical protein ACHREM_19675 [Polyangiales bacterium]
MTKLATIRAVALLAIAGIAGCHKTKFGELCTKECDFPFQCVEDDKGKFCAVRCSLGEGLAGELIPPVPFTEAAIDEARSKHTYTPVGCPTGTACLPIVHGDPAKTGTGLACTRPR